MQKIIFSLLLTFVFTSLYGQNDRQDYIEKYKATAVQKMREHGIPASITLAQGILESGAGNSKLTVNANNHFGIKCHNEWRGKTFTMDDDEKNECFRKYKTAEESFEDHSQFLITRDRYAFLFEYKVTDYKKWAYGLKKAGYATNPQYAKLLIKVIEENNLDRFDKIKRIKQSNSNISQFSAKKPTSRHPEFDIEAAEDFKPVSVSKTNRMIYQNNKVRYVLALKQDNWEVIAEEFGFYTKLLKDLNSAKRKTVLNAGDRVYIEKKKRKARVLYHIVQAGESLRSISQLYAMNPRTIKRLNHIKKKQPIIAGQRLSLR